MMRGISSAGRARGSQSRGQGFDPPILHHITKGRVRPVLLLCHETYIGGSNPAGRDSPVDCSGPSTAMPYAGRQTAKQTANPPMLYQVRNYLIIAMTDTPSVSTPNLNVNSIAQSFEASFSIALMISSKSLILGSLLSTSINTDFADASFAANEELCVRACTAIAAVFPQP